MQHGSILYVGKDLDKQDKNAGKSDTGTSFATDLAKSLLCQNHPESLPLIEAGTHPDLFILAPEESATVIKIDQVRELCDWANAKPTIANQKIAFIQDAHTLNIQAANALLKTLEEPHPHCLFVLTTDQLHRIIPTIRSRCIIKRHRTKDLSYGLNDLSDSADNPLKQQVALDLKKLQNNQAEPVTLAQTWLKKEPYQLLYWMLVVLCEETQGNARIGRIQRNKKWWDLISRTLQVKQALDDKLPFNVDLMIENLLIEFACVSRAIT